MNGAQLKGISLTAQDCKMGAAYEATRLTISKTADGYEARKGGKLVGISQTREGAKELLAAL